MKSTILSISLLFFFLGSFAQSEIWRHSDTLGGIYGALNMHIDANDYLYVGGPAIDSLDINDVPSASLVFKLDSGGHYYWNQGFIYSENVTYFGMAGDKAGNSYLYGEYYADLVHFFNGFLTRVDSSGNLSWVKHYDYEYYYDAFQNATVDKDGNILVAGTSDDSFANQEMISIKYSPADTVPLWSARYIDTTTFYYSNFAQTDNAGGQYSIGQAPIYESAGNSMVLLKYNSSGVNVWKQIINSTAYSDEEPASTNADSLGNLYIADNSSPGLVNYNSVPFLLKISPQGTTLWQKLFGDNSNNYALATSALDDSYFYIAGARNDSIYLAKISASNGEVIWTYDYPSTGSINKICLKNNAIYVTGSISEVSGNNFFTAKLSSSGYLLWKATYQDANGGGDQAFDIVADNSGNIYVAGQSFETSASRGSATVIKYHDNNYTCTLSIDSIKTTALASDTSTNGVAIAVISGGAAPLTYAWSNGGNADTITGLVANLYCLTVTDMNGCKDILCDSVKRSICQLQISSVSVTDISSCHVGAGGAITINVTGGTGTVTYSTDSGLYYENSNYFANLFLGSYVVEVKDAANCTDFYAGNPVNIIEAVDTPIFVSTADTLRTSSGYSNYSWYSNNQLIDTDQFLALNGSYCGSDVYVKVVDANGCSYTSSTITAVCTGIDPLSEPALSLNVYPNPFGDYFNVKVDGTLSGKFDVTLFDICGQQVYNAEPAANTFSIPTLALAPGMYLLRLQAGGQFIYKQVVKGGE